MRRVLMALVLACVANAASVAVAQLTVTAESTKQWDNTTLGSMNFWAGDTIKGEYDIDVMNVDPGSGYWYYMTVSVFDDAGNLVASSTAKFYIDPAPNGMTPATDSASLSVSYTTPSGLGTSGRYSYNLGVYFYPNGKESVIYGDSNSIFFFRE